jgi:radical SAM protein with 4Fe4S-binding SPASM domain
MALLKSIRRDKEMARELARCVADCRPYRLLDMKVYLTRRCNLRCWMCGAWINGHDGGEELSADEVKRAVTQAKILGLANLKLFGGEPMLRLDVEEIVEHAAGMGIRCSLTTNGTLLSQERARALVDAGLAELDLSLDASHPALHDEIRGCPGTWMRAMHGLQWLVAHRDTVRIRGRRVFIRANAVVMRQNYEDMPRLVKVLSDLDVDEIALNPVVPQDGNSRATASQYVLSREDITRYNQEVAPRIREVDSGGRLSRGVDSLYLYGTSEQDREDAAHCRYVDRLQVRCCLKPWYYMVVRENGDVVGCNTVKDPAARLGSIRDSTVAEIWQSQGYQAFRARCKPPQLEGCDRCCYRFALVNREMEDALGTAEPVAADRERDGQAATIELGAA